MSKTAVKAAATVEAPAAETRPSPLRIASLLTAMVVIAKCPGACVTLTSRLPVPPGRARVPLEGSRSFAVSSTRTSVCLPTKCLAAHAAAPVISIPVIKGSAA